MIFSSLRVCPSLLNTSSVTYLRRDLFSSLSFASEAIKSLFLGAEIMNLPVSAFCC